jgi:capsular exopolysaccharide synthesis family protein
MYLAREGGLQVILITGPGQGEGKTTTTANLAVALAQSSKRVIAISCDLRRPRLHRYFDQTNDDGLSDILTGRIDIPTALRKTSTPGLLMISSGHVPTNPAELLASPVMSDLIEELRKVADFILLDTAPALVVSDALGLAPKADGTLVVVDAASTHRSALSHLRAQLDRVGGHIIGSLLNNLDRQNSKYYDRYGGYYVAGERYKASDEAAVRGTPATADPYATVDPYANGSGSANGNGSASGNGSHAAGSSGKVSRRDKRRDKRAAKSSRWS